MIIGSGGIVHNFPEARFDLMLKPEPVSPQALPFDSDLRSWISSRNHESLANWETHPCANFSAPTPEHLIPALIIAGASEQDDEFKLITEGTDMFSITWTSFAFRQSVTK